MEKEKIVEVYRIMTGTCFPYGSKDMDEERFQNLEAKIFLAEAILKEIEDATELRNYPVEATRKISQTALDWLKGTKEQIDLFLGVVELTDSLQNGDTE